MDIDPRIEPIGSDGYVAANFDRQARLAAERLQHSVTGQAWVLGLDNKRCYAPAVHKIVTGAWR